MKAIPEMLVTLLCISIPRFLVCQLSTSFENWVGWLLLIMAITIKQVFGRAYTSAEKKDVKTELSYSLSYILVYFNFFPSSCLEI